MSSRAVGAHLILIAVASPTTVLAGCALEPADARSTANAEDAEMAASTRQAIDNRPARWIVSLYGNPDEDRNAVFQERFRRLAADLGYFMPKLAEMEATCMVASREANTLVARAEAAHDELRSVCEVMGMSAYDRLRTFTQRLHPAILLRNFYAEEALARCRALNLERFEEYRRIAEGTTALARTVTDDEGDGVDETFLAAFSLMAKDVEEAGDRWKRSADLIAGDADLKTRFERATDEITKTMAEPMTLR